MAKKQFKAESKRLLDLMIHSIYTHKEIFLRELISNASDAMDKLYFRSLTDASVQMKREDYRIELSIDAQNRTLSIQDNGIGMTQEELENNLGIIAKSGSFDFKQNNEKSDDFDIIGQFGVGFYAAFMVSEKVTVISRAFGEESAHCWESYGADGYTISACERDGVGTTIVLQIKENTEEENYSEFLDEYRIRSIVKKYSDYIRYPIQMLVTKEKKKEDSDDFESYQEMETLNSMVPIWKRSKSELKQEDYQQFYKEKFYDFNDPIETIHFKTEGAATYSALLYIPSKPPYDFYTKEFEKGLALYSSGVLIMDRCSDLLPDYFSFVKGLVDSEDLSLNISREMLQHDRQLRVIAKNLDKKIRGALTKMLSSDREKYETFFAQFGLQLKYGVYASYGTHKEDLKDLLLFYSSFENKQVTLAEYVSRMPAQQDEIYYACGTSIEKLEKLPQAELVRDKGYEVLYLTDDVDEFALKMLGKYQEKSFKNVSSGDLNLETEEEKEEIQKKTDAHKELFTFMQDSLKDKVKQVRLSGRLKSNPVCLTAAGELSLEMEKVLNAMPADQKVKADKVLELNENHPIFQTLCRIFEQDKEQVKEYSLLLYQQAALIEGIQPEDPVAFTDSICRLMAESR